MDGLPVDQIVAITKKHGALNVRVFGSRARGEAGPGSDLDLLVTAGPDLSLLSLAAMTNELEDLLEIPVEILTDGGIHPYLRDRILAEARPLVA